MRQRIHNTLIVVDRYLWLMGDEIIPDSAKPRLESFYPPFVAGIDLPHQGIVDFYNLHNGISYTGKMASLYWIRAQVLQISSTGIRTLNALQWLDFKIGHQECSSSNGYLGDILHWVWCLLNHYIICHALQCYCIPESVVVVMFVEASNCPIDVIIVNNIDIHAVYYRTLPNTASCYYPTVMWKIYVFAQWRWGGSVSCGGHHRLRGKTTTGSALDGAVFDIAQILAYLVHNMSRSQLYLGFGHFGWLPFFGQ